jgi:hypothetical protein
MYRSQRLPNFVRSSDIGIGKKLLKDYSIYVALIAYNHQQGTGDLIQLWGLGKKAYLNPETSQWNLFQNLGIKVYDIYDINEDIDLDINAKELENNKKIVREWFSTENLKKQLKNIFEGG